MALSVRPRGPGSQRRFHRNSGGEGGRGGGNPSSQHRAHRLFRSRDYGLRILSNLSELREKGKFCDVELVLDGKTFSSHKVVLAASCPYFEAMFGTGLSEGNQKAVEIRGVSPSIFEQLLSFMYKGELHITQENCQDLLSAANMLGLSDVVQGCCDFLQRELHPSNCVGIRSGFGYSRGWLHRFKMRHGLVQRRLSLTSGPADPRPDPSRDLARWNELHKLLSKYDPEDIYSFDETGLFYQLEPSGTVFAGPADTQDYARLTVALMCNATGSDKSVLLVIGGKEHFERLGKLFSPSLYCDYRSTPCSLMTPAVFAEVIKKFDRVLRIQGRQAVVLVDHSPCHTTAVSGLTNVSVHSLPFGAQPLEMGIFMSMKAYYRRDLIRHYIAQLFEGEPPSVNVRRALPMLAHAWNCVSPRTIRKCWAHTGVLPDSVRVEDDSGDGVEDPEDDIPLIELQQLIGRLDSSKEVSATDYVTVDDELETSLCRSECDEEEAEDSKQDTVEEIAENEAPVKLRDAVAGATVTITFFEQLGEAEHISALWAALRTLEGKYLQRPCMAHRGAADAKTETAAAACASSL